MIKIDNTQVAGWESALRGMRNPLNSWSRSDSTFNPFVMGKADYELALKLSKAGSEHAKYKRMINVWCDITAPLYWENELSTYKVGTVMNSCSLQHKGAVRDFEVNDFSWDDEDPELLEEILNLVNSYRKLYIETKDYKYFRMMRQLIPMGYNYRFTWSANYETLTAIYHQRKNHALKEWVDFCQWIETLPYSDLITCLN